MTGRELTIRIWEGTWGREGLWCRRCRRTTPVEQLLLEESGRAVLRCETCTSTLHTGAGWLTAVDIRSQQSVYASVPACAH